MRVVLVLASFLLLAPLLVAMIGGPPHAGTLGHSFGVSNAIWLVLLQMTALVLLCGAILRFDDTRR